MSELATAARHPLQLAVEIVLDELNELLDDILGTTYELKLRRGPDGTWFVIDALRDTIMFHTPYQGVALTFAHTFKRKNPGTRLDGVPPLFGGTDGAERPAARANAAPLHVSRVPQADTADVEPASPEAPSNVIPIRRHA